MGKQFKNAIEVPVDQAAMIAEKFEKDMVVIITYSRDQHSETVTTFGKTVSDSDYAAAAGNNLKKALRWDEAKTRDVSAKVLRLVNALERAVPILEFADGDSKTLQEIKDVLKIYRDLEGQEGAENGN
ncbi:hypothetical protein ACTJKN_05290 [Pedobacter sp. 22163]|uniref:hypothetical protein n=1 Tax=Pedobacter sp. 22163 TaxID=3453883 RepID=UPI003F844DC9